MGRLVRADTPEHNQALNQVAVAISHEQLDQAEVLVTRLISGAQLRRGVQSKGHHLFPPGSIRRERPGLSACSHP